ncbi:MAG: glycoside hydrolase family 32 protein [Prolixibacteraceae bacterium]|jgi:fructan beta-fructosidase
MKNLIYSLAILFIIVSAKSDTKYYNEKFRPQYHFSPEKHWLFESNGIVFYQGEYHFFHQNISIDKKVFTSQLGHSVSKDLVHWKHLPNAFTPDEKANDMASCRPVAGSVIMDSLNVSGLQQKVDKTMMIFYSDSEGNQNLAFSNDKGSTWTKYAKNPLITNPGMEAHDPKVFFYPRTGKWILALYIGKPADSKDAGISFYSSKDLLHWEFSSHLEGFSECPDIFEVAFEGKPAEKKWVVMSGSGEYKVGTFDGTTFTPETGMQKLDYGKNFYATQTVSNMPHPTVIQLAWMKGGEYPEMTFNGQMSFPVELHLRATKKGPVLCRKPIAAIASLFENHLIKKNKNIIPGLNDNLLGGIKGDAIFIKTIVMPKTADSFGFIVRNGKTSNGTDIHYDTAKKLLDVNGIKMTVEPIDGKMEFEILLDRSSIEIFVNGGQNAISTCFSPAPKEEGLMIYSQGGELFVESLEAHTLKTAWSSKAN